MTVMIVINAGGNLEEPTPRQQQLLRAACQQIEADPHFQTLGRASLDHAEINAGLAETQQGYLYLRYDVPGAAPQEFWANIVPKVSLLPASQPKTTVNWKTGQVRVALMEQKTEGKEIDE